MKTSITIIGAGIVGLAIAERLSRIYDDIYLFEQHESFGREASSRNSEVIHASIYYPQNSLKGKLCLRGNELMYEICANNKIPHSNCTKLIVATNPEEERALLTVFDTASKNGAKGVRMVDEGEIKKIEPKVYAKSAVYCPSSGIVDSHKLMEYYERKSLENSVNIIYNHKVTGLNKTGSSFKLLISDITNETFELESKLVINAAGLGSARLAELAGIDIDKYNYRINYHKGIYFRVVHQIEKYPKALIYPVPPEPGSVGIHTTPDLYGGMRLGPHFFWTDNLDYSVDETYHDYFYVQAKKYLPFLKKQDIVPDMSGIMSSIQKSGEGMKDFVIREESDKNLPGLINLIGIESPGVTASPAIAEYIETLIKKVY